MKKEEILSKLNSGERQVDLREAWKLLAEIEQPQRGTLDFKVSEKGAVSVYGLQRMPVNLHVEQWTRLLDFADDLRQFLKDNDSRLKRKEKQGRYWPNRSTAATTAGSWKSLRGLNE